MKLTWVEEKLRPRGIVFHAACELELSALLEFWRAFRDKTTLQQRPWDYTRCEFWFDSGRLIAFPAKVGFDYRVDDVIVALTFPRLLAEWEARIDDDDEVWEELRTLEVAKLTREAFDEVSRESDTLPPLRFFDVDEELIPS